MQQAILYTSIQGIFRDYGDFAGNHSDTLDEWDYVTQDADFWAKYVLVLEDGKPVFVCHAILGDDCDRTISTILINHTDDPAPYKDTIAKALAERYEFTIIEYECNPA